MTMPEEPTWQVEGAGIREETELSPHGTGLQVVHVVPYVITSGHARGHHGVVRVLPTDFTPAKVEAAIAAAVANTHGIAGLGA